MKDPNFLVSILPLSDELNYILQRIFQLDPMNRIALSELRNLILHCPRFTQTEDDVMETEEMAIARPETPARAFPNFDAPITPSTHDGRAVLYKTKNSLHQPPPTPLSPMSQKQGRNNHDSCSSIASNDSLSSHEQKEGANPPRIAPVYMMEPPMYHGVPDEYMFGLPLDHNKGYPQPQYQQHGYAMA